jgi:hypothetical protein
MKDTTRCILIDPIAKTITDYYLPESGGNKCIYKAIGCDCFDHLELGEGLQLFMDDNGLISIPRETTPPYNVTQGFFVIHDGLTARHLIAGKGLVSAYDSDGVTVDLPLWVDPQRIAQIIKFVPNDQRNAVAGLGKKILADAGLVFSKADWDARTARHAALVKQALALCRN